MKVFYLFDGNNIKNVLIGDCTIDQAKEGFANKGYKIDDDSDWLKTTIIELQAEGTTVTLGANVLTTICLNNKPYVAYLNMSDGDVEKLKEDYISQNDDYRQYKIVTTYMA